MADFSKRPVTVTLTGEEWTTLLALLLAKPLSEYGYKVATKAKRKLADQVVAGSK